MSSNRENISPFATMQYLNRSIIFYALAVGSWQLAVGRANKETFYRFRFIFFIDFFPIHGASGMHGSMYVSCFFIVCVCVHKTHSEIFRSIPFHFLFAAHFIPFSFILLYSAPVSNKRYILFQENKSFWKCICSFKPKIRAS